MEDLQNTIVISVVKDFSGHKKRNFYITTFLVWFIAMLFQFTMVFFFTFQLKSVAMVGIFLGIGNLVSFLVDVPVGILQKYFKPKTLFLFASALQLIAMAIFSLFVFQVANFLTTTTTNITDVKFFDQLFNFFFGSVFNLVMIIVASVCYGINKEITDVTSISYIMNNVPPAEYNEVMARCNIFTGMGELIGLLMSWVIMAFDPKLIVFSLVLIIWMVFYFTSRFFDNKDETVNISDITHLKVSLQKTSIQNIKEYVSETVSKQDLKGILEKTKYIFLKPKEFKTNLNYKELVSETKETMITTFKILTQRPINITIYWTVMIVLTMWFWDTFASTFLISFLDTVKPGMSYVLLWFIAIPAFGLQEKLGNLGRKFGVIPIALTGLLFSGVSLLLMGIFSHAGPFVILSLALINSVWYAASMSLGTIYFLDVYNKDFARYMNLKEIDANASAGPMKIVQNLANVIGLMFGGIILGLLNYTWFFITFWLFILWFIYWSWKNKSQINV